MLKPAGAGLRWGAVSEAVPPSEVRRDEALHVRPERGADVAQADGEPGFPRQFAERLGALRSQRRAARPPAVREPEESTSASSAIEVVEGTSEMFAACVPASSPSNPESPDAPPAPEAGLEPEDARGAYRCGRACAGGRGGEQL